MEVAEKKLIRLLKSEKAEGFELLIRKYEKYIYTICYHYTFSREDALDLLQDVYVKLYRSIQRLDDSLRILPWIKKITVNTCLNFIRDKKTNIVSLNSEAESGYSTEELIASSVNVEDAVSFEDTKRIIEDMVKELPDEMRMAVVLRHVQDASYDEIARLMSCPVGTVKTYLFRGRKILKDKLKEAGIWEV